VRPAVDITHRRYHAVDADGPGSGDRLASAAPAPGGRGNRFGAGSGASPRGQELRRGVRSRAAALPGRRPRRRPAHRRRDPGVAANPTVAPCARCEAARWRQTRSADHSGCCGPRRPRETRRRCSVVPWPHRRPVRLQPAAPRSAWELHPSLSGDERSAAAAHRPQRPAPGSGPSWLARPLVYSPRSPGLNVEPAWTGRSSDRATMAHRSSREAPERPAAATPPGWRRDTGDLHPDPDPKGSGSFHSRRCHSGSS
jgi:hypothetical protein